MCLGMSFRHTTESISTHKLSKLSPGLQVELNFDISQTNNSVLPTSVLVCARVHVNECHCWRLSRCSVSSTTCCSLGWVQSNSSVSALIRAQSTIMAAIGAKVQRKRATVTKGKDSVELTQDQLAEFRECFTYFDTDQDGKISGAQFCNVSIPTQSSSTKQKGQLTHCCYCCVGRSSALWGATQQRRS